MNNTKNRVVITGMSVFSTIGNSVADFWENSLNGKIGYDVYQDAGICNGKKKVLGKILAEVHNNAGYNSEELGRPTYLALSSAMEAIEDSGINFDKLDRSKAGVCIANAISNTPFCEEVFKNLNTKDDVYEENIFKKGMFSFISYEIANHFDLNGNCFVMSTGCTGGIDSIGYGFESIKNGDCKVMICGGVEAPIANMTIESFEIIGALAKGFENNPFAASRPFDKNRNGFVLSEGCATLVLEDYENAIGRGANIYGEILAYTSCNNAYHMTDLLSDGADLANIINEAIDDAELKPEQIGYINAHGSSTLQNDKYETEAYKKAFGDAIYQIPISSTKSMTGHPLSAASAIETVHTLLALKYGKIPPTANYEECDEGCELNCVTDVSIDSNIEYAITNANGFSGLHSVLVLSKI